jgi:dihydroorotase
MVHISKGADTPAILKRLRPGDILTHCFQGRGDGLLIDGALIPEVKDARANGVIFDVGHGAGSFNWDVAKKAFEYSFYPDTISTDLHRFSIERLAQNMPATMSKFLHLGMSIPDVILKSTWAPAKAIGRGDELGTMKPGAAADLFVFEIEEGEFRMEDTHGKVETAKRRIRSHLTVKSGALIPAGSQPYTLRKLRDCDYEVFGAIEEPVKPAYS